MPTPSPADQYWELTTSTITHGGETLHRLRATRAIPEQGPAVTPAHASATLFRTADGHCLVIGSWHGTVDQLAEYGMNPEELQGLTTIAAARIKAWSP